MSAPFNYGEAGGPRHGQSAIRSVTGGGKASETLPPTIDIKNIGLMTYSWGVRWMRLAINGLYAYWRSSPAPIASDQ